MIESFLLSTAAISPEMVALKEANSLVGVAETGSLVGVVEICSLVGVVERGSLVCVVEICSLVGVVGTGSLVCVVETGPLVLVGVAVCSTPEKKEMISSRGKRDSIGNRSCSSALPSVRQKFLFLCFHFLFWSTSILSRLVEFTARRHKFLVIFSRKKIFFTFDSTDNHIV